MAPARRPSPASSRPTCRRSGSPSTSGHARRREWASRATAQGYGPVLHYIRVPLDTAIAQASERNARATAYAHDLDGAAIRHLASIFEEPADDEGLLLQIIGD